jgi:hypothetical protein
VNVADRIERADPSRDVQQHDDDTDPGEDVFLPLGETTEDPRHGGSRFMRRAVL